MGEKYGLVQGSIHKTAFEAELLEQAIRGTVTDEDWRTRITAKLHLSQPESDAISATREWSSNSGKIDTDLLSLLSQCKPTANILLFTNATSRLPEDLAIPGLADWFTGVVNSSDTGNIKPEPESYRIAIQACNCRAEEIAYIDDSMKNTLAVRQVGMSIHHHTGVTECREYLAEKGLLRQTT